MVMPRRAALPCHAVPSTAVRCGSIHFIALFPWLISVGRDSHRLPEGSFAWQDITLRCSAMRCRTLHDHTLSCNTMFRSSSSAWGDHLPWTRAEALVSLCFTGLCVAMRYIALHRDTSRYCALPCDTLLCPAVPRSTVLYPKNKHYSTVKSANLNRP